MSQPLTRRDLLREGGLCATAATRVPSPLAAAAMGASHGFPRHLEIR